MEFSFSPLDLPSYSPDLGNPDSVGHGPCQGPHEQDCGPSGCRGSCGVGPVRLFQKGEDSGTWPRDPSEETIGAWAS